MTFLYKKYLRLGLILACYDTDMKSISDVYNMKVAETTQRIVSLNEFSPQTNDHFRATITLIEQVRTTYNHIHQKNTAGMATIFYSPGAWYARLETAFG